MIKRLLAALVACLSFSGLAATAPAVSADAATSCNGQLAQLRTDVAAVPITDGKTDKERAGLLKLVDDATALVARGKTTDALVKLSNLQTKVDDLAAAGRISTESASTVTADIAAAATCLAAE